MTTIVRGTFVDTPVSPFQAGTLRVLAGAIALDDGRILARGSWPELSAAYPAAQVLDLQEGLVLPGFVDTHVHFPQIRVIGGLGMPLLDWLDRRALPEEARLADRPYAEQVAGEFVSALAASGTTSALVFGSHFAGAVDALFGQAERVGLRVTSGLVVSDRILREDLLTTPQRCVTESVELAKRWHDAGRLRYAVTPRFSLSCSDDLLQACHDVLQEVPAAFVTSHVNENVDEVAQVTSMFGTTYVDTYHRHGLLGPRTVLAHNVHPVDSELALMAAQGASVAHCPSSNSALGSGMFPMRSHLAAGVRFALGTDVGGGTNFSMLREGLQAYFVQRLRGADGVELTAAHLLWLATAAGAQALGLSQAGDLSVGKEFDAVHLRATSGSALDVALRHAADPADAVAKVFALGEHGDIAGVWVGGDQVR